MCIDLSVFTISTIPCSKLVGQENGNGWKWGSRIRRGEGNRNHVQGGGKKRGEKKRERKKIIIIIKRKEKKKQNLHHRAYASISPGTC